MREKRGRPVKDVGKKTNKVTIRLSNDEFRKLVYLEDKTGETKSNILINSLETFYNLTKFKD